MIAVVDVIVLTLMPMTVIAMFVMRNLMAVVALGGIYILLAIAFRSYAPPLLFMMAIPFVYAGAVFGHLLFDMPFALFSFFGVVAAAGVVINDNLVLIDRINQIRSEMDAKASISSAVIQAAVARFRPILLTSVTTFVGLLPIISERSAQSEYLKPLTLSLGFGVAFASFVPLILVPCLYLVVDDARDWLQQKRAGLTARSADA